MVLSALAKSDLRGKRLQRHSILSGALLGFAITASARTTTPLVGQHDERLLVNMLVIPTSMPPWARLTVEMGSGWDHWAIRRGDFVDSLSFTGLFLCCPHRPERAAIAAVLLPVLARA